MAISDNVVRFIRRISSPTLGSRPPDEAELVVDSSTHSLKYRSNGTQEVAALGLSQTFTGVTAGLRRGVVTTDADTYAITAAESGTLFVCTKATGTQVFTLPAASTAGLEYTFSCGHADGEIRLGVGTGDNIVGKTHGAENGTGIATTATTGLLLNTASGNVVGDWVTVRSDGITTYRMTSIAGAWSAA